MPQNRKRQAHLDPSAYILLLLNFEGAQSLEQIQEHAVRRTLTFVSRWGRRRIRPEEHFDMSSMCNELAAKKLVAANCEGKYELTPEGRAQAEAVAKRMEKGASVIENQVLKPSAAARNITVSYVILAVLKMAAGFLSGSVGLIADGADTVVDTAASSIVWAGIKFKKEVLGTLTIIALMFVTAVILFFNSAASIIHELQDVFTPMSMPFIVIAVEIIVALSMFTLSFYQRFVGRRSQSLPLISQSIDSQNSIYSSIAVIIGAVFTLFGVHWVDAVVGGFIAVRITIGGAGLAREAAKSMRGQQPEFSKYKLPFEEQIGQRRMDSFRNWILYSIRHGKLCTKQEIVASLEKAFRPRYLPGVFAELHVGRNVNFEKTFTELIAPLIGQGYLVDDNGKYMITDKGKTYIKDTINKLRYKQTEL
jgi:cation diffusion facilitator family transporter